MSMQTASSPVADWFKILPLSDPRCNNDSCNAFKAAHKASQKQISYESQFLYGHWVVEYYCGILALACIIYLLQRITDAQPRPSISKKASYWQRAKAAIRYLSYRRLGVRLGIWLGLPSLGVSFILILSLLVSLIMSFAQNPYYRPKRGYGSPPLAVRTGLMSAALIPLIVALSGKVNIITMLTGLGHEKLNVFHRYVGWLMFLLSSIHTIPFFICLQREGGFAYVHRKFYAPKSLEFNGTPGYAFAFALVALSLPWIRRRLYEVFVWSHIIFAILFLALMFWHFGDLGDSWAYLWATLAIWLAQIVGRTFMKTSSLKLDNAWFETSAVALSQTQDGLVRMVVHVGSNLKWEAGQHVFLRIPQLSLLDNHPFSIVSIHQSARTKEQLLNGQVDGSSEMLFLVRPHTGFTTRLSAYASENVDPSLSVIIDGPYGSHLRRFERSFDSVVLIAGGVGISAVSTVLTDLGSKLDRNACVTKHVRLIWMIRHTDALAWVWQELQNAVGKVGSKGRVAVDIYVTNEKVDGNDIPKGKEKQKSELGLSHLDTDSGYGDHITSHYGGRPDLHTLLSSVVQQGRTAIVCCGPDSLKIDTSNACAALQTRVLTGQAQEIALHTESFDW